jgi:hypothetical protein
VPISVAKFQSRRSPKQAKGNWQSAIALLRLFVTSVLAATATELAEFQPVGCGLLILGRHVVPALAFVTLEHNVIAWHRKNLFGLWSLVFGL